MFEQLKVQKESAFQPPPSPANPNKLQQYFDNSAFLQQQDELVMFIKDLPIINLKQVKSINSLISLLIKQNQLLGRKCQQQIGLMKQEYSKHEKLVRTSKEMKIERDKLEKEKKQIEEAYTKLKYASQKQNHRQEDYETKERKLQAQSIKANAMFKQASQKISKYQQIFANLSAQDFKKCEETIKANIQGQLQQNLEEYCQNQRKRYKYFAKVKGVVQQFCIRLEKIARVVSPSVLVAQLSTETSSMMDLISELCDHEKNKKKKKKTEGSQRNTLNSEHRMGSEKSFGFFQGMIQKLIQSSQNNSASKQSITSELEELKRSLQETKSYYESIVRNLKEQYTGKDQQIEKRFQLKQETIKYYEEELEKFRENNKNLNEEVEDLNSEISNSRKQIQQKSRLIESQFEQIEQMKNDSRNEIEQIKKDTQSRVEELKKMACLKIQQRDEVINQFNERRKKQQQEHDAEVSELKFKIKLSQQQCEQKQKDLKVQAKNIGGLETQNHKLESTIKQMTAYVQKYKKQIGELEQKMSRKTKQGDDFKETLNSLQHEKSLQAAYINQLETKNQTLSNKIKSLQTKAKSEAGNKKEMTAMKNAIVQQKQRNEQFEAYCSQLKEQNQRLKSVVKEMKKELQDVYVRLSELKHIEAERERLYLEAQNSERVQDGLVKEHEQLKFEMLKLEAENKKMQLELKHFRNIVSRIKILQQE